MLGSGPGGYTAAFRAADLGLKVVLVERYETLGGVCLNVGCIPSKALLHVARVLAEGEEAAAVRASASASRRSTSTACARSRTASSSKLTGGLARDGQEARRARSCRARAASPARTRSTSTARTIAFEHCLIAAGSQAAMLPGLPDDPRIVDSTGALELRGIPERLLVIGGGIIGLEMATVYDALGSKVTVVEMLDQLMPGADPDVVKPLQAGSRSATRRSTSARRSRRSAPTDDGLVATFGGGEETFDRILVAVGRRPNGGAIGAEAAGVSVDERGFIPVDRQMRTNVPHIFAIGDVVGEPMLAHKASHEAKVAAEVIAGHDVAFDVRADPERRLHGPRGRVDGAHRDAGEGGRDRDRDRGVPVGGVRPRARHRAAPRA